MAPRKTVGILGGGQLGRMLTHPAALLGIPLLILDSGSYTPAKQTLLPPPPHSHPDGPFTSETHIRKLASACDILTVEIEHVNADVLEAVEKEGLCEVQPSPQTIRLIQNKYDQKKYLAERGVAVAPFEELPANPTEEDFKAIAGRLGLPLMLKAKTLAYDGRGNSPLKSASSGDIQASLKFLGDRPLYAEGWAPFVKEVAVMVVRNKEGEVRSYDAVETIHRESILRVCLAPLRGEKGVNQRARELAEKAVGHLEGAGIFGVEMFLMPDGELLLNEIAPRPHNSGHHTIEACLTSQFENHLRAILSLPLGSTALRVPSAAMVNILGASSTMDAIDKMADNALTVPGAAVHLYGKAESRKARKMGHITVTAESDAELNERLRALLFAQPDAHADWIDLIAPPSPAPAHSHAKPLVGIIMGSDSDLPVMHPATKILEKFGVPYELTITSAHRTPERMVKYAKTAADRGLRAIIAGAGGAAHLPGMVASETSLPVIGVPVKASVLDGVDSLYSIVQMPRGIPCATVGINNSTNAALLAVRILGTSVPALNKATEEYSKALEEEVLAKADILEEEGWDKYIERLKK
ncbi:phosphoribosylaminoimidazole carboxylase [Cryptococcus deneoformans JEC21]|uniref:Phosphoribosylaminoimidazole carboxylase n=1 Tax=Cryptococcus deneoformans (strain JEC21 / ATCC MYA-565) TaxID=214684 RepID=PUR6_CRYD1|nr:phosphoribosylaminoimidazole carboxylase [Cryptococcus neoformans var. neoformans JEC21]P0CQ36.1 RecName: Full=Phosphoribosylaminoimidazole carboxylase; AltName: Full=AIR carboxylase; Short=AIRC [Cryptococcus neoformans var. neoformans JEC21]AAW43646.1 phosphoribosylaminoimidazole carboxylase [Cryptococcus neoformans var. neoformans JEC21]